MSTTISTAEARKNFAIYLNKLDFKRLKIPVVNNVDARIITEPADIKQSLVRHMNEPVLWWQSMQLFRDMDIILQIGPGNKFARILQREWKDRKIIAVDSIAGLREFVKMIGMRFIEPEPVEKE